VKFRAGFIVLSLLINFLNPFIPSSAQALAGGFSSAPRNITQTSVSGGVTLTWNAPADTGNGITGYLIQKSTTGLSGSWNDVVTTNTNPYTILGLANSGIYLRIAGITSAGTGAYGYPWTRLYKTVTKSRSASSIIYEYNGSATVSSSFSRVRYLFEDTITATYNYADVDFYKWAQGGTVTTDVSTARTAQPSISNLQVPSPAVPFVVQAKVSDLTVFSSIGSTGQYSNAITNGFGINGRVEHWDENYATYRNGLSPIGNNDNYDFDDQPNANGSYGSFQVHNTDLGKTIFAWNEHSGANPDIGFGDGAGIAGNPDWTFCAGAGTCPTVSSFALTIYVNSPITPGVDSTPPTVSRGDAKTLIKSGETVSVRSTEIGTAYLIRNTVTVTNLASITGAASNVKNSVSISAVNTGTTLVTSGLLDGIYNLYAVDSANNISAGILSTVEVDTTPPVATAFSVNTAGNSILMTIGESATLLAFDASAYTVSDSGSALSVASASISGLVITLNLSRAIPTGATVSFAYSTTGVATSGRWSDAAGNQLTNVTLRTITNNSSVPISVALTVSAQLTKGASTTVTAIVSVAGKVTFAISGKRIPGCLNKVAIGSTPISVTCTFKPSLTASQVIKATLVPTLSSYPATSSSVERYILKRNTLR